MNRKLLIGLFAVLLSAAAPASLVHAAKAQSTGPCAADVQKFCQGIQPGDGRIVACLKAHENDLSAACKERRVEIKKMAHEVHAACKGDVEEFCTDVKPGRGRILKCVQAHSSQLSAACKDEMNKAKTMRQQMKKENAK